MLGFTLIEMYHQIIWHTICVLVPGRVAAEDIPQEVWIDVWRGLPGFQREKAFRPWLLRVVTNRCRKSSRRVFPFNQPLDMVEPEQLVAPDDLLEHLLHQETYQEIQDLLRELPLEQQRVLALRYFAELELAEIALVMGDINRNGEIAFASCAESFEAPHAARFYDKRVLGDGNYERI
jgi:RNA polymerase sigma factor (sigma-70 family)